MRITRVKLHNFRNLAPLEVAVSPRVNILLGRNGQGKTNFLEGLSYLALGRSWRTGRDRELIGFDEEFCHVTVEGRDDQGDSLKLTASLTREGKKKLEIDGQTLSRQADLVGHLSVVRFDPDEVELAKGSPEHRRRFLDYTLSLCSANYFRHLLDYRRAIAQKNRLLKQRDGSLQGQLDAFDGELVRCGVPLLVERARFLETLEEHTREAYRELAPRGGRLELRITTTVERGEQEDEDATREAFVRRLEEMRAQEITMKHALVGPHRDRLEVDLGGHSLRRYGSQGEKRTASIALKLAQGELLYERTNERPVVLLDDIFSELDRHRTEALQTRLHREHQLFIATARVDHVVALRDWDALKVWTVRDGVLTELDSLDDDVIEAQRRAMTEDA